MMSIEQGEMMATKRVIPKCPDVVPQSAEKMKTRSYLIKLITPMFGGGVEPGEPDAAHPVRATAIRGHLRFWWRIVKGYSLGDKMWRREEEIFGSTTFPSPLRVRVELNSKVDSIDPQSYGQASPEAYTLFAAIDKHQKLVKDGLKFKLRFMWEKEATLNARRSVQNERRLKADRKPLGDMISPIDVDLDTAINAWLTFGGLGARTRRGCGAVQVEQADPALERFAGNRWLVQFQTQESMIEKILLGRPCRSAADGWHLALKPWRLFRQPLANRDSPEKKQFPEAETIRRATRRSHRAKTFTVEDMPNGFPRAELGMPIGFQFKDEEIGDPPKTILLPEGQDADGMQLQRMASPFILRPWCLDGRQIAPMIVLLKIPHAKGVTLVLSDDQNNTVPVKGTSVRGPQFAPYAASPLAASPDAGSAIEAFLKFAEAQGFQEVTR